MFLLILWEYSAPEHICSQIVVLDQREETKPMRGYRAGHVFYREGYGWCWEADCHGGNRVWRADPGAASIGCSRAGRPVEYKPIKVLESLFLFLLGVFDYF